MKRRLGPSDEGGSSPRVSRNSSSGESDQAQNRDGMRQAVRSRDSSTDPRHES
jgi:hypothetical protein